LETRTIKQNQKQQQQQQQHINAYTASFLKACKSFITI